MLISKSFSFCIFRNMVTISCKVVQRFKELLPHNANQGQVEMFAVTFSDQRVRFLVFQFCGRDWIFNVAEF
jgi:hypothetical protein